MNDFELVAVIEKLVQRVQIDHIRPFGKGGTHDDSNLRTLCRVHNQYAAEMTYGEDFMDRQRQR